MQDPKVTLIVRKLSDRVSVIDIHGEVNAFAENALMEAYALANSGQPTALILNFSGLEYMNSSGIGLLVTLLIRANRQKQRLLACNLPEHYQRIFSLTRLDESIKVYPDETGAAAAAEALEAGRPEKA